MSATARIITTRAVARRIRSELRRRWPGVRFRVRTGRAEWTHWVIVRWHDGPPAEAVREITAQFQAMSHGRDRRGPLIWAVHGVLSTREITARGYDRIAGAFDAHRLTVPRTTAHAVDWTAANRIDIAAPVQLFAPFPGTYATGYTDPIPLSLALAIIAEHADLSPQPRGRRVQAPAAAPVPFARTRGVHP